MSHFLVIKYLEDGTPDIISSVWLRGNHRCKIPCQDAESLMTNHISPSSKPVASNGKQIISVEYAIRIISRKGKIFLG